MRRTPADLGSDGASATAATHRAPDREQLADGTGRQATTRLGMQRKLGETHAAIDRSFQAFEHGTMSEDTCAAQIRAQRADQGARSQRQRNSPPSQTPSRPGITEAHIDAMRHNVHAALGRPMWQRHPPRTHRRQFSGQGLLRDRIDSKHAVWNLFACHEFADRRAADAGDAGFLIRHERGTSFWFDCGVVRPRSCPI